MYEKVSIVVPVYNTGEKLKDCLDSIINQTYSNFEVLLINDGSNDNSAEICNYYAEKDRRIIVKHYENMGVSSARNKGIDLSTGKYLVFVDSDDTIKNNMLEEMVYYLEQYDSDVLISGITFIESDRIKKEILPDIEGNIDLNIWEYICKDKSGLYGYVPNKMYKMNIIKSNNIYFDEKRSIQEDLDFALRVYSKSDSFYLLKKSYYLYKYEEKNRVPDSLGYMEIEINKRNILNEKGILYKYMDLHCNKISNMIFCYLYNLPKEKNEFINNINQIYELDNIYDSLDCTYIKGIEMKFIIFLLRNKFIKNIRWYFIFRLKIIEIVHRYDFYK